MTSNQPNQSQLSNIDKFGIGTGVIGLIVDLGSLIGLFAVSNGNEDVSFHIWLLMFLSIVYSTAAINFHARRYFHKRALGLGRELSQKEIGWIEVGTSNVTVLISFPVIITYFIFAFSDAITSKSSFFLIESIRLGLIIGLPIAILTYIFCHFSIRNIYIAFDPHYGIAFDKVVSNFKNRF